MNVKTKLVCYLKKTDFFGNNKYLEGLKEQRERIDEFIEYYPLVLNETLLFFKDLKIVVEREQSEISLEDDIKDALYHISLNGGGYDTVKSQKMNKESQEHHLMKLFIGRKLLKQGYNVFFELSLNIKTKTYTNFDDLQHHLKNHLIDKLNYRERPYDEKEILLRIINKILNNIEYFNKKIKGDTYLDYESTRVIADVFGINVFDDGKYIIAECDNDNISDKWNDYYGCFKSYHKAGDLKFIQVSTKKVTCPSFVENIIMGDFQST